MRSTIALAFTALLACVVGGSGAPAASAPDDHATALAALSDIAAARAEIIRIEDSQAVGHAAFVHAAQRALNSVVGRGDELYRAADGDPGDGTGALGNVDRLLDRQADSLWTPALQGAKANLLAVVVNLHDAMREKEMEDYETDLTQALANFALVTGHPSEDGVLGGLTGALANTSLGVPAGAPIVSGCGLPARAPAYGVVDGRLAFIALPRGAASPIPVEMSVSRVVVSGDAVVLYTRQAQPVAALCRQARLQRTRDVRTVAAVAPTSAASYTAAQAQAGQTLFAAKCASCHGANLQGVAAPGVAGTEFLTTAHTNKWTLEDLRTLVVQQMPLNNPGSLTPQEYANVIAFLLAANCYPAGSVAFPVDDKPGLASVKIGPVAGAQPTDPNLGTCSVK